MKKILLIGLSVFFLQMTAFSRVLVLEYNICNPPANNMFDYVSVGPSSQTWFWLNGVYINGDLRQITCEDPGPSPCTFGKLLSTFDEEDIMNEVADQISLGAASGHTYSDGSTGTHTTESVLEPDITLNGFCYLWSSTPTCRTIVIVDEEAE